MDSVKKHELFLIASALLFAALMIIYNIVSAPRLSPLVLKDSSGGYETVEGPVDRWESDETSYNISNDARDESFPEDENSVEQDPVFIGDPAVVNVPRQNIAASSTAKSSATQNVSTAKSSSAGKTSAVSSSQKSVSSRVAGAKAAEFLKVNINTAGLEELQTLNGIGPVKGQSIIDYRDEHGPFLKSEDLINVKGIGEKTLAKLIDFITVG